MTRTEVLTARGYDPETIAGNGNGHGHYEGAEASPAPATRTCQGCGAALDGRSTQRWCTNSCRKRHSRRRAEVGPVVVTGAASAPQAAGQPSLSNGGAATSAPTPAPSLLGALEAGAGQLPAAWSVQVAPGQVSREWRQPALST